MTRTRFGMMVSGAIVAGMVLFVAPTLGRLGFFNAEEAVNVATALELQRDGHWKMPTLAGEPRSVKPPLAAWVTAEAIPTSVRTELSDANSDVRAAARRKLAWIVRLPILACGCLMLIGTYALGRAIGGRELGVISACAAGTNLLFLWQLHLSTVDFYLAAFVTLGSAFLATAVLEGRRWVGYLGAGAALGLALLSKGPVALLQSGLPVIVFVIWRRYFMTSDGVQGKSKSRARAPSHALPLILGLLVMILIGLSWYAWIGATTPGIWVTWIDEVFRHKKTDIHPDPWYDYFKFPRFYLPWIVFFVGGVVLSIEDLARRNRSRELLALFLFVVPLAVMLCFSERKERYLLPLVAPMAVLIGRAMLDHIRRPGNWKPLERVSVIGHWLLIGAVALLPLAGAIQWGSNAPWLAPKTAAGIVGCTAGIFLFMLLLYRRRRGAIVVASVLIVLIVHALDITRQAKFRDDQTRMTAMGNLVLTQYRDASVYCWHRSGNFEAVRWPAAGLSIETDRTIHWTSDLSAIPTGGKALLLTVGRLDADRAEVPPGWEPVFESPFDKQVCTMFVWRE